MIKQIAWTVGAAYVVTVLYSVYLNGSGYKWIPAALILTLLVYLFQGLGPSVLVALFSGLFMDLHFFFIGQQTITLLIIILTIHSLRRTVLTTSSARSTGIILVIACIEFYALMTVSSGLLLGWNHFFPDTARLVFYVRSIVASSLIAGYLYSIFYLLLPDPTEYEG